MSPALLFALVLLSADTGAEIDFATEIVPVLTKAGCNAGACHGAAAGRGGFRLSLPDGDAAADYEAIVQALEGRRINLVKPASSLLLKKPTGYLDHGGEVALDEDSAGAKKLTAWITAGAPRGRGRRLTDLQVSPSRHIGEKRPASVLLRAVARFDDGPPTDVTQWTVFMAADSAAVAIQENGAGSATAVVQRRGQQVVIARFLDRVVPLQLIVPLSDMPVDLAREPRTNFIDDEVLRMLTTLRLPVSTAADDATFLRRLRLDLTGRLPELDEVRSFLRDSRNDKRAQLADKLLSSSEFADHWTLRFARQLRLHSLPNDQEGVRAYADWIKAEIAKGTPLNVWAKQLLTATGDSHEIGPANFGRMVNDARGQAELVGEFFLGVRLGCANCHNHPLDRWTQDDYHGLAAVFARLDRGRQVQLTSRGAVTNLRTGDPAVPRIPGQRDLPAESDNLAEAATWLTSDDNRQFARATVNRLWRAMFGRGLIEPADDLRDTNPATHPELLDLLARDFARHRYDLRHTLRLIALSQTYARSGDVLPGNATDDCFYSHSLRRPLGPEVLADAIADVTGVATDFKGQPAATRAVSIIDPLSPAPSLDVLGRCSRAAGCADSPDSGGLPAQLHLLNGELINRKLTDKAGRLQNLLAAEMANEQIVAEFYLRGLGRVPTAAELTRWCERLKSDDPVDRAQRCEDFVWSLLNSRDFVENH